MKSDFPFFKKKYSSFIVTVVDQVKPEHLRDFRRRLLLGGPSSAPRPRRPLRGGGRAGEGLRHRRRERSGKMKWRRFKCFRPWQV